MAQEGTERTGALDPARRTRARILLYAASAVVLADMYLTQPILPFLSAEFGVSPVTAGLSVSATVLFVALASLVVGPLSDMFGRKPVLVTSCALLSVPTFLCALSADFSQLLLFRALQGLCVPGLVAVGVAYLGDLYGPVALGGAVGGWIASNVAGGLGGRVAGGLLSDAFGWRTAFVAFAVVTLLMAMALACCLPSVTGARTGGWREAYAGMFSHLGNRSLTGAFVIGGALFFGFIGIYTYLPYLLTAPPFSLPKGVVAWAFVTYLAGIAVAPVAGVLSGRFPKRALFAAGLSLSMLGALITLAPTLWGVGAGLVVLCLGMFTVQAVAPAFVNLQAGHSKGGASALYLMFFYLGGTLGAVGPGLAWEAWGWPGVVGACVAAFVAALGAAAFLCREP